MLKNYLKIALRNLLRHKLYSFINIGGLSLGLAACIMIFLFVENELSYDTWIADSERVYRMEATHHTPGKPDSIVSGSPAPIVPPLTELYPQYIETSARLFGDTSIIKRDNVRFIETVNMIEPTFFDVFDLPMSAGDRSQLFSDYNSVILSQDMATKYFGKKSPIGETIDLEGGVVEGPFMVAAVMEPLPDNTHLEFDFLLHFNEPAYEDYPWVAKWWLSSNAHNYFKLRETSYAGLLEKEMPAFMDTYAVGSSITNSSRQPSEAITLNFLPLEDIHLHSRGKFQIKPTGDIAVVYSFAGIATLILVIAIINFTNLSTIQASLRAREIALRKVVGATRRQLILQFLGETLVTVFIALTIAFAIVELCLPWFNDFVTKLLSLNVFDDPALQLGLLGVLAVVTIGAGAHPAFKVSSLRPARSLHSNNAAMAGSVKLRAILTTFQFTISIGLMITTAVIYGQLRYAGTLDLGFDKNNKMLVSNMAYGPVAAVAQTIKQEIERLPGVEATSYSARELPLTGYWDPTAEAIVNGERQSIKLETIPLGFDFLEFYGAQLKAGRLFSEDMRSDVPTSVSEETNSNQQAGIINETTARQLGFSRAEDAIGTMIRIPDPDGTVAETTVVGVVNDMHLRSLRDTVGSTIFLVRDGALNVLNINLSSDTLHTRAAIEAIWNKHAPEIPFSYSFIEEDTQALYETDARRGEVFAYFSAFAILVSCLGLYGLASFTAERRVKEIGVRKVMGASVTDIVKLLTFQFSKPVLFANLIAWPLAWLISSDWLQGFQYRIDLSPTYFFAAGATALLIACLTVAGHAYRTARANPVAALKHE